MARIIVIDDELDIVNLVTEELRSHGHEVIGCTSPRTALEILKIPVNQIDLVLVDVVMPNTNGLDFVREVNRLSWFYGQVALMSCYTNALNDEITKLGIEHVLKKPFTIDSIGEFIKLFDQKLVST